MGSAATAKYGPIAGWDVSAITNMDQLFQSSSWLTQLENNFNADVSSWDTSRVTSMLYMFGNVRKFNQPLSFDTSKVTTMRHMFYVSFGGSVFNQPLSFDTSRVVSMYRMFYGMDNFNQPLSFDTSSVTDMFGMFQDAYKFNQPLSFDTSSVTSMTEMFKGANSLSAANKLLIRCAWAETSAFTSAGYGSPYGYSRWAPGSCA